MQPQLPQPFLFENGPRMILLLHGFTGSSADTRQLARFLTTKGYSCYAPHLRGHGEVPEELVKYGPDEWWQDVQATYQLLKDKGYQHIAVAGLSLGGIYALKLSMHYPVISTATFCSPMMIFDEDTMYQGVLAYARNLKKYLGQSPQSIEQDMQQFNPMPSLSALRQLILDTRSELYLVDQPVFIAQGELDNMINPDSANIIYNESSSSQKVLKWYDQSGHVITIDKQKQQLFEDYYQFLETLPW